MADIKVRAACQATDFQSIKSLTFHIINETLWPHLNVMTLDIYVTMIKFNDMINEDEGFSVPVDIWFIVR